MRLKTKKIFEYLHNIYKVIQIQLWVTHIFRQMSLFMHCKPIFYFFQVVLSLLTLNKRQEFTVVQRAGNSIQQINRYSAIDKCTKQNGLCYNPPSSDFIADRVNIFPSNRQDLNIRLIYFGCIFISVIGNYYITIWFHPL